MKIGYWRLRSTGACHGHKTERSLRQNFHCLGGALEWNRSRGLLYFRVPPSLLPATSGPQNWIPWNRELEALGAFVRAAGLRLSIRPGPDTYVSAASDDQFRRSAAQLLCFAALLDAMGLDATHKIQVSIEAGEVKNLGSTRTDANLLRFDERHRRLAEPVQKRLVVETPDRRFALRDTLKIWSVTGVPIVHRASFASVDSLGAAVARSRQTWSADDGAPVVDLHSSEAPQMDRLLATAPEADYMVEAGALPEKLCASSISREETSSGIE